MRFIALAPLLLGMFAGTSCTKSPAEPAASPRSSSAVPADDPTSPLSSPGAPSHSPSEDQSEPNDPQQKDLASAGNEAQADWSSTEQAAPQPRSPFRRVLSDSYGSALTHRGRRLWAGDDGIFDLETGKSLGACPGLRGYFTSAGSLYFAARMSPFSACPDEPFLLEHSGGTWKVRRYIDAHSVQLARWVAKTTIAAVVPYRMGPPWGYELVRVSGGATPPRPKRSQASDPDHPEQKCYSELQRPISLTAFDSGALMIVGESRCDLGFEYDENATPFERRKQYRPVVESFPRGIYQSTVTTLPLDEVTSIQAAHDRDALLIFGTVETESDQQLSLVVYFDGKTSQIVEAPRLLAAQALALLPGPESTLTSAPPKSTRRLTAPLQGFWVLTATHLRPVAEDSEGFRLPSDCSGRQAWFQGEHAWLVCEDGLYTTDPDQPIIEPPESNDKNDCDALSPRPEYAVPGIYKMSSHAGPCSRRRPSGSKKGGGKLNLLPQPQLLRDFGY